MISRWKAGNLVRLFSSNSIPQRGPSSQGLDRGQPRVGRFTRGPYAGGKWFVAPSKDPQYFIQAVLIFSLLVYGVMSLPPIEETIFDRRRRLIRERIRREFDLPEGWDSEIETLTQLEGRSSAGTVASSVTSIK